ncbi:hypothetical protein CROQUDRAFT_83622 [Cronartium quercuum f. sp. fusiforme G11]|uniref:Eisosome component PIL1-domain-containing protein n=1 Tax=Cronartium quercuum f. sp. fusiforme G11 TaxID=708437 RepID=A0A9P6T834_9BASI|nr:hypothetical protein CROQUDRAFT_83622 [Cronartium quercuum f. sp. fusiforme G11]
MGFDQPTSPPPPASASANQSQTSTSSKRSMFGSYLSSWGDTISEKASLTNLRQVQATYDPRQPSYTLKLQLLINSSKGVIQATDSLARQSHRTSQALFTWAQDQSASIDGVDLVDVGDRLAYLIYKTGDLFLEYGQTLEMARIELKEIRNFENELTKSRDRRKVLENQITKMKQDPKPKADHQDRLGNLSNELNSTTAELSTLERTLAQLKRAKLKNSYSIQFHAMRELGEKLAMIGGYGDLLVDELKESVPGMVYDGEERTAWIRGAAAESLAGYRGPLVERPELGQTPIGLSPPRQSMSPTNLAAPAQQRPSRDTRLFGESHRQELANLTQSSGVPPQHPVPSPARTTIPASHATSSTTNTHAITSTPSSRVSGPVTGSFAPVEPRVAPQLPARPKAHPILTLRPESGNTLPETGDQSGKSALMSPSGKPLPNYSRPSSSTSDIQRQGSIVVPVPVPAGVVTEGEVVAEDLPAYALTDSGPPTVI